MVDFDDNGAKRKIRGSFIDYHKKSHVLEADVDLPNSGDVHVEATVDSHLTDKSKLRVSVVDGGNVEGSLTAGNLDVKLRYLTAARIPIKFPYTGMKFQRKAVGLEKLRSRLECDRGWR